MTTITFTAQAVRFNTTRDVLMGFFYVVWVIASVVAALSFASGVGLFDGTAGVDLSLKDSLLAVLISLTSALFLTVGIVITVCLIDMRNILASVDESTARLVSYESIKRKPGRMFQVHNNEQ